MAKWCPITNSKVVYLECLECEERICEESNPKPHSQSPIIKNKPTESQKERD